MTFAVASGRTVLATSLLLASMSLAGCMGGPPAVRVLDSNDPLLANPTLARAISRRMIVNAHEHIQSAAELGKLTAVMDQFGVSRTLLLGSPRFTITLNPRHGFTRYDENNAELMAIHKSDPQRYEAWPTINPLDPQSLAKVQDFVSQGARGVKLYLGHGYLDKSRGDYLFHVMRLDDPRMLAFYEWCETHFVPLIYHVNPYKPGFAEQFVAVLTKFPDLKVIAPHFILSSIKDSRLREFLDTFPNLYSDISFGHDDFLIPGLKRISRRPEKFRRLFSDYPSRFIFGTDLVVTSYTLKTSDWMGTRYRAYLAMLSLDTYETELIPGRSLNGLGLSGELLERVLHLNYEEVIASRPKGTEIIREINWENMGVAPSE